MSVTGLLVCYDVVTLRVVSMAVNCAGMCPLAASQACRDFSIIPVRAGRERERERSGREGGRSEGDRGGHGSALLNTVVRSPKPSHTQRERERVCSTSAYTHPHSLTLHYTYIVADS